MAIQGLRLYLWVGWLCGFLYMRRPWGPPEFSSWISLHTVWSMLIAVVQCMELVDIGRSSNKLFGTVEDNNISNMLAAMVLGVLFLCFIGFRITFIKHARSLNQILNNLCQHNFCKTPKRSRQLEFVLISVSSLCSVLLLAIGSVIFGIIQGPNAFISVPFSTILIVFVYCTTSLTRSVSFALVSTICLNLGIFFEELCDQLEGELARSKSSHLSFISESSKHVDRNVKGKGKAIFGSDMDANIYSNDDDELLIKKFDDFVKLSEAAAKLLSPLVFYLIVGAVTFIITGAYESVIGNQGVLALAGTVLTCMEQLVYIGLVFIGQNVKDVINARKQRLQRILTLKSDLLGQDKKAAVAKLLLKFNWNLSAYGIFDVDRKLISGIMATSMTYLVILFQFQMAMKPFVHSRP